MIFLNILILIVGMFFLIKGADLFVDGASKVAKAMKMPSLVIVLTLVSIGTSCSELSVSVQSAIKGMNDMSFGNAIGSCIFNIILILAISSVISEMPIAMIQLFDVVVMLLSAVVIMLLSAKKKQINKWSGFVMIVIYVVYFTYIIVRDFA